MSTIEEATRYFLRIGKRPWDECTIAEFRDAERAAGFWGATGGFGNGSTQGTQMHRQAYFDWSEGARLLTPLDLLPVDDLEMQSLGAFVDYAERKESEAEWRRDAQSTKFHIQRTEKTLKMIGDKTIVLVDPTPVQVSIAILEQNLTVIVDVMKKNMENRVRRSEVAARYRGN